jgi:hypothetical protein
MWPQKNGRHMRVPALPGLEKLVEQLESRDSVVFESVSLPSIGDLHRSTKSRRTKTAEPPYRTLSDFSDDFVASGSSDISHQESDLNDRIYELEASAREKDVEIARLRNEIERCMCPPAPDYRRLYDEVKREYDRVKAALTAAGKFHRVQIRAVRAVAPPA